METRRLFKEPTLTIGDTRIPRSKLGFQKGGQYAFAFAFAFIYAFIYAFVCVCVFVCVFTSTSLMTNDDPMSDSTSDCTEEMECELQDTETEMENQPFIAATDENEIIKQGQSQSVKRPTLSTATSDLLPIVDESKKRRRKSGDVGHQGPLDTRKSKRLFGNCPQLTRLLRLYADEASFKSLSQYDIAGCRNDKTLFKFGRQMVDALYETAGETDAGIPVDDGVVLPRSFVLDHIHRAASKHALFQQLQLGKSISRETFKSPCDRRRVTEYGGKSYRRKLKVLVQRSRQMFANEEEEHLSGLHSDAATLRETSQIEELQPSREMAGKDSFHAQVSQDAHPLHGLQTSHSSPSSPPVAQTPLLRNLDPDFDGILEELLEADDELSSESDGEPAMTKADATGFYGTKALCTLDTSSLLAFGVLAEEYVRRMLYFVTEDDGSDEAELLSDSQTCNDRRSYHEDSWDEEIDAVEWKTTPGTGAVLDTKEGVTEGGLDASVEDTRDKTD